MAILQTRELKKYYGAGDTLVKALDGVELSVENGEFVAIIGTSGSGKSTLLHMLGGLDRPTSGTVTVDGRELSTLKDEELTIFRRRKIGFVFQAYNLVPVLSVYENIVLPIQLDGGAVEISTGVGFFDHMLTALAVHGGFGLQLKAVGDWHVDCHHTVEDVGIVLGRAFKKALGDRAGIERYGHALIPMDEALGFCAVDVSGRPYLAFDAAFPQERVGDFDTCMTEEFFRALSDNAGFTLHLRCPYGKNAHHMIEALFKAAAHALCDATAENSTGAALSTKGTLGE